MGRKIKLIEHYKIYRNILVHAVKQIQIDKEKEALRDADAAGDDDAFEAELFDEDNSFLQDEDFQ